MHDANPPACEACAACCTGNGERYVPVTGDDHARLGAEAGEWTRFIGNRCFMRMSGARCIALRTDAVGRQLCAIYERRPQICRDLERGSAACAAERLRKLPRLRTSIMISS